jgi:hypothetical protein
MLSAPATMAGMATTTEAQETVRRALLRLMRALSEEQYAAGWLIGWGPMLWERVHDDSGRGLMPDDRTDLRILSDLAGGWWDWPEDAHEPVFFSLDDWNARYRALREGAA